MLCCGFDYGAAYGSELGGDYIEVHHIQPLSDLRKARKVIGHVHWRPLCANCHRMVHRFGVVGEDALKKLRNVIRERRGGWVTWAESIGAVERE